MFKKFQHIHFVGIGGAGMSGIAEVLVNLKYKVTGSDLKKTDVTDHLEKLGAKIFIGHRKKNIKGADVVVTSTAVSKYNPEVITAHKLKIPVIPRIEMLAELARLKYAITIAGTHGKTTTTSLAALVLQKGGLDPTIVIGGKLKNIKSGAKLGKGDYLVAESDESDGSFLKLSPTIAVVTNIDNDHLDYYSTLENIKRAFIQYVNRVPFYGCVILCNEDQNVKNILPYIQRKYYTYGLSKNSDYYASNIKIKNFGYSFDVFYKSKKLGSIKLKTPGVHNILNSLASIAIGLELGIKFSKISSALNAYSGVGRRMEVKGIKKGITVIDDYGHHPTEVKATIGSLKEMWPKKRLIVLFQPHRYSRTAHLYREFGKVFNRADITKLLEIYSAGEKPIPGISSNLILKSASRYKNKIEEFKGIQALINQLKPGDVVLTLGAGDVWKLGEEILKKI